MNERMNEVSPEPTLLKDLTSANYPEVGRRRERSETSRKVKSQKKRIGKILEGLKTWEKGGSLLTVSQREDRDVTGSH